MPIPRHAVIDVGTNSVKLLVAEVAGGQLRPVCEQSEQTRLGHGFYREHRLQPENLAHTARAVALFADIAMQQGAASVRVIATSAARDAVNQHELLQAVRDVARLPLEIVSGEQEALWAFRGVTSDPALIGRPLLVIDVGGGSTQAVLGEGAALRFRHSYRLGAVRLLERLHPSDPPQPAELAQCREWLRQWMREHLVPPVTTALAAWAKPTVQLVGIGGTSHLLAAMHLELVDYDRAKIESVELSLAQIQQRLDRLWSLSLAERRQLPGLPLKRADVILTGVAIHEAVMECCQLLTLRISTRGIRYGALLAGAESPAEGGAFGVS